MKSSKKIHLTALVVARNEQRHLPDCLKALRFCDQIVVLLDRSTDDSAKISERLSDKVVEGAWDVEATRRNAGLKACNGDWILEVDADERVTKKLAEEILAATYGDSDYYRIPVDNYVGKRLVRDGWGAYFGKSSYPGLFRRDYKIWTQGRIHASYVMSGLDGGKLANRLDHFVDDDIADMIERLNRYTTENARDMRERGKHLGPFFPYVRRLFTRFFKCYVQRHGYREGIYGFIIALCAGLYPLLSYIKARSDDPL